MHNSIGPVTEYRHKLGWRTWLWVCGWTFVATLVGLYACIVLVDPFATGRFTLTQRIDVTSRNTRLAKAGLVRDPQFDAAIFGNSSTFSIDPADIGAGTGHRVVQLAMSVTVPAEQLMMARLFQRLRPGVATLQIFMLDDFWCRDGSPADNPFVAFPYWLYVGSSWDYLSHIFFVQALESTLTRIGIWLGIFEEDERSDGFGARPRIDNPEAAVPAMLSAERPVAGPPPDAPFPALDALAAQLDALQSDATVALVFLPVFITVLPAEGSAAAARFDACKARVRDIAQRRPGTAYVDLRTDNPAVRDVHSFVDGKHFRSNIAQWVAAETVRAVKDLNRPVARR